MFKTMFNRKSVAQIQGEAASTELKRSLGKWNLVSLGIGCIIGAGIFVMTGTAAAQHAGPAIMISFIFTGIACAFVGLCYAELAALLPVSGSAYTYAYATLGEVFAWVMGWLLLLEYGVAAATVAVGWSGYLVSFLATFGLVIPPEYTAATGTAITLADGSAGKAIFNVPAFMGIGAVTALLVVGVSESAKVNNVIVAIKLAVVLLFIGIGVFYIDAANWHPFIPENTAPGVYGWDGIFRAASIIFFAYVGFEAVSTAAQEAKDPQKDMPFGILGSLLICTILYMGVSAVLTGIVPFAQLNVPDPMAVAVDHIGLGWFAFIVKLGALTGLSSVMLVLLYGQTRIFYTMSKDGLLPKALSRVHPKFNTPYINTIIVGLLVAVAAGTTPINLLGDLVSLGTLVAFMIVCLTVLHLRKTQPDMHRPFKTPGFVRVPFTNKTVGLTPILGFLTCGYLVYTIFFAGFFEITESGRHVLHLTGPYVLIGALIYVLYGNKHSELKKAGEIAATTIQGKGL